VYAAREHREQRLDDDRARAAESLGEHVGAQQHHRARLLRGQRRADAARVAAHEVELQLAQLVGRHRHVRELPEAGVDAVDDARLRDDSFDRRARSLHARARRSRERHPDLAARHPRDLLQRQWLSVEFKHESVDSSQ
jgi:hypothetical protein